MNIQQAYKIYSFQELMEKYQISQYGFLYEECLTELPEPFKDYQLLKVHLPQTISSKFGQIADNIKYTQEKHSFKNLSLTQKQLIFMYKFFTLSYSRYVWQDGVNNPKKIIPQAIALPFLQICQIIGIRPSISYAAQIIYNWGFINDTKQINIQNLYCPMTMSGTRAQQWFYLIMIAIEIIGGDIILDIYNAPYLEQTKLLELLKNIQRKLIEMKNILKRMYEENPLQPYNQKVRQYLMGTKNIPGGVRVKDTNITICQTGGSAAQSPLIQTLNIFLRIQLQQKNNQFIQRNKCFMPRVQRQFLSDLQKMPSIKQKIQKSKNKNMKLIQAFNQCINRFHQFRSVHFSIVDHYVFKYLKNEQAQGAGNSNAKHFLTQMIKDTNLGKIIINQESLNSLNKFKNNQEQIVKLVKQQGNKIQVQKKKEKTIVIIIIICLLILCLLVGLLFFNSDSERSQMLQIFSTNYQTQFV